MRPSLGPGCACTGTFVAFDSAAAGVVAAADAVGREHWVWVKLLTVHSVLVGHKLNMGVTCWIRP